MISSLLLGAAMARDCMVLRGGLVYLPEGPKAGVDVEVVDGRIARVGPALDSPGCAAVNIEGKTLTPGFIEVQSQIGLVEIGQESATHEDGGGHASADVVDGYNPASTVIPVTRMAGITSAIAVPVGGLVAGRSAWFDLTGSTQAEALQRAPVALSASINGSAATSLAQLRLLFEDARAYAANRAAYEQNRTRDYVAERQDLEALQPMLRGEIPLVVSVDRASDIEALLRFAKEQRIKIVISGGGEAWKLADAIAAAGVPVIVDPLLYGPGSFDQIAARPDNAALLQAAGVTVILSSFSTHNARTLSQSAGNAVREGLPHDAAIAAVTSAPARVFGVSDHGQIAPGAKANLVIWSGDPLELLTSVEGVYINGEPMPLRSRQTALRDRYRTLPGRPAALDPSQTRGIKDGQ